MDLLKEYLVRNDDGHGHDHDHDHDHDHETEEDGSPVLAKTVAMCVLFLASFTLGVIPMLLSKWLKWHENPKNNLVVNLLLGFGGGVLLCTTFLHLLPEVAEHIGELQEIGKLPEFEFHLAELLMCAGFFTMYFVEECVHIYLEKKEKHNEDLKMLRRSLSVRRGEKNDSPSVSTNELVRHMEEAHTNSHDHSHVGHSHIIIDDTVVKSIRGLLVVLALSVHELFEGLAVGLESSPSAVWYMFGAVSAHKLVIAFCIGVELVTIQTKTVLAVIYVMTFAIVSPMGIGIGIAISDESTTDMPSVILQGLASGTLLYVVFFEIIQRDKGGGLKQYLAIICGFLVMFGLTILGIGMGIALSEAETSELDVTSVFLQGMAAGTLLYVVFFEVLARERSNRHSGVWQLIAIMAGFAVMFSLQYATGHEHGHSHSHEETAQKPTTSSHGHSHFS